MELKEALNLIWENRKYDSNSVVEAVSHLNEEVAETLKALSKDDIAKAQRELEDAFSCMFIAMKVLNIDPDEVIYRQIERMQRVQDKTMHIFKDRVEIRVGEDVKGGWNIWGEEDIADAQNTAKEFGCRVVFENESLKERQEDLENA